MRSNDTAVARMVQNYSPLIKAFIDGRISPEDFETAYLAKFKGDSTQVVGPHFDILDELFADVDDYVSEPGLRERTGGISGEELRVRARSAYARLLG